MQTTFDLERKSSALTLSDMEIFIFPELLYSLVLANILSPRLWAWRADPWFEGLARMTPYRRVMRVKQFIMDHYVFNLDLDTWGLTTKERELARFRAFVDEQALKQSNALFGYEGDKYYFDIDIRTHFGLDKYDGNVIPYWKTETVEAMDAFRHKPNYATGAGECVSLATLYAAALFVVAEIPLEQIYLMATPLHSQNFIDVNDGVLCNNRRVVTRKMWFNGTAISAQARRALENERVTVVSHATGHIHTLYAEATIAPDVYSRFGDRLRAYLRTGLTEELLGNFLRHSRNLQRCFQMRWSLHGVDHYIGIERVLAYEEGCSFLLTDATRPQLMAEIEREDFQSGPLPSRIVLNDLEAFVKDRRIDINRAADVAQLKEKFASDCLNATIAIESLIRFCHTEPRLPAYRRAAPAQPPLDLAPGMDREAIRARLEAIRTQHVTADLAFHASRQLLGTSPEPFLLAAVQRNPVSVLGAAALGDAVAAHVRALPGESIYDEPGRLAQPDEVWNFGRGDGLEKAVLLANLLRSRQPDAPLRIEIAGDRATLVAPDQAHGFETGKGLPDQAWAIPPAAAP